VEVRVPRGLLLIVGLALVSLWSPAAASADTQTFTVGPITVQGYEVKQDYFYAPSPKIDGYITHMEVDVVDADGKQVPIQRLMLHHIVFGNLSRHDRTCDTITDFGGYEQSFLSAERFYGAGEERAKLDLPPGYGYHVNSTDVWGGVYMFMNHRATTDSAYIRYTVDYVTDLELLASGKTMQGVHPYWLDVNNCKADPIYNVPGTGKKGSTHRRSYEFTMPESGRLVAAGGHVHGGAKRLTLNEPDCGDREIGRSVPTWGYKSHPYYNVRPVLHEPGPIAMSGFGTATGIPLAKGERLRLDSEYDNRYPHTRVMGIMVAYVAPDPTVTDGCAPLPNDMVYVNNEVDGRKGPIIPYRIPLTARDQSGNAVTIKNPPGRLQQKSSGSTLYVGDDFFVYPNVKVTRGADLTWDFGTDHLHNVTLARGPVGIGSPNLNDERTYTYHFRKKGTYRLFCALHPVQMHERVVVVGSHGKR
jgi:hypothetical protein